MIRLMLAAAMIVVGVPTVVQASELANERCVQEGIMLSCPSRIRPSEIGKPVPRITRAKDFFDSSFTVDLESMRIENKGLLSINSFDALKCPAGKVPTIRIFRDRGVVDLRCDSYPMSPLLP